MQSQVLDDVVAAVTYGEEVEYSEDALLGCQILDSLS